MTAPTTKRRTAGHDTEAVWQTVAKQGDDISNLKAGVASLDARMDSGFTSIGAQFHGINTQLAGIAERVNRPPRPPDIRGWAGVLIALGAAMGALGVATIKPIEGKAMDNREEIRDIRRELSDTQYHRGRLEVGLELERERLRIIEDRLHDRAR